MAGTEQNHKTKARIPWLIIIGAWLVAGFGYGSQTFFDMQAEGMHHSYWRVIAWGLTYGMFWALLTGPILMLGYRFPLERPSWFRSLCAHAIGVVFTNVFATAGRLISLFALNPFGVTPPGSRIASVSLSILRFSATPNTFIYVLIASLGTMLVYRERARDRELESNRLEAMLAQAEVSSLRSQLNPHFLFNTLNGIAGLVRTGENETAAQMIAELSQLLRRSLDEFGKPEVSLAEEVEFIKLYLDIEQMRFPDRMKTEIEIEAQALQARVPSLLLQPIVENAIRHAVAARVAATLIRVSAKVADGQLSIAVRDDGPGLPIGFDAERTTGIGLANSRDRLKALFGDAQSITIRTHPEGGTEVQVTIPFETQPRPTHG